MKLKQIYKLPDIIRCEIRNNKSVKGDFFAVVGVTTKGKLAYFCYNYPKALALRQVEVANKYILENGISNYRILQLLLYAVN